MRNTLVLGICFIIIGALFIADGVVPPPIRWLRVGMGIVFVIGGILYFMRARSADDPAA